MREVDIFRRPTTRTARGRQITRKPETLAPTSSGGGKNAAEPCGQKKGHRNRIAKGRILRQASETWRAPGTTPRSILKNTNLVGARLGAASFKANASQVSRRTVGTNCNNHVYPPHPCEYPGGIPQRVQTDVIEGNFDLELPPRGQQESVGKSH